MDTGLDRRDADHSGVDVKVDASSKVAADVLTQEYGKYFGLKTGIFRGGWESPQRFQSMYKTRPFELYSCASNFTFSEAELFTL